MRQKLKKALSVLSALAMTLAAIPAVELPITAADATSNTALYGDVNGDSVIDSSDTAALTKAINNQTSSTLKNADLNADGKISNSDVQLLKQYVSGEIKYFPVGDIYDPKVNFITRGEWIHNLVTTFDMSVDDASTVTEYYTDLSGNQYENDIELAANFGVFEVEGDTFSPNSMVTREFAAHTANFCAGYKNNTQADSYADYDNIYYVDDAAVAVEKNWFALVDNQFRSDMYMKFDESKKIISDVTASLEADKIDENADQIIKYNDNVIQLDKSVQAVENDDTVTISSDEVALTDGDVFIAYIDGQECLYKVESVSTGKNGSIVVKTADVSLEDAFEEINVQGSGEVDYGKVEYENDTPQIRTYSTDTYYLPEYQYLAQGSGTANDINLNKTVNLGSGVTASLSGSLSNIRYDYNLDMQSNNVKSFYLKVNADSNLTAKISGSFTNTKSKEVKIASVPLKVGALSLHASVYATISVSGEISLSYKCNLVGGVSYTKRGGWRTVKSFHSKAFSIESNASAAFALKASVEARLAGTKKLAEIYIQAGVKANGSSKSRDDGTICSTVKAYLFAELGTNTILNDYFDDPLSNTWSIISESNSPVKLLKHWENGGLVSKCKYENISYGSTGSAAVNHVRNYGNYAKYGSNFEGLITSDEPPMQDYAINSDLKLEGDMTINGNAIITADVDLNGHTLTVTGNVTQTGGGMSPNGGTLNIGGNYEISSDGYLNMLNSTGGAVNVSNDFIMKSEKASKYYDHFEYYYFSYGALSIGGNFYQYIGRGATKDNFEQHGTKVVFTGSGVHEIYFDSANSYFTDISVPDEGKLKFTGIMRGFNLINDTTIVGDTTLYTGTINMSSHKLTIEGDFTQDGGDIDAYNNTLNITGKYILNGGSLSTSCVKKSTITIGDSFEMNGGNVDLGKLKMTIAGDITQTGGEMYPNGGTLNVGGNYEVSSDGYLNMDSSVGGKVNVSNDFIIKSEKASVYHNGALYYYFSYGTLSIGGNFYQYIGGGTTENNFAQNGTKVVFIGSGIHKIHFESVESYYNNGSYLNTIEMDNGSSIYFEWDNKEICNMSENGTHNISIKSNIVKAVKEGSTKLTIKCSDNSESTINIVVNKSDYVEEPPVVTTPVTTKPVTTNTPKTTTVAPTTTAEAKPLGDVDSDNKISVADVVLLQRYLVKKVEFTDAQWKLADLNSDGKVNVFDVIILKRKLLK